MWGEPRGYLLPWAALAVVVCLLPLIIESRRRSFDLYQPLVYAAWSHVLPIYVFGGFAFANGWRNGFEYLIPTPERTLPDTMGYVCVGFLSLYAGYYLPWARRAGAALRRWLPARQWAPNVVLGPGILLIVLAIGLLILMFRVGLAGFQTTGEVGSFDAALSIGMSTIGLTATSLVWLGVFQSSRRTPMVVAGIAAAVGWVAAETFLTGRRGGLVISLVFAGAAFWLSGRRVRLKHAALIGAAGACAIVVGVLYGTTFRVVKGTEERVTFERYMALTRLTFDTIAERGLGGNAAYALLHVTGRLAEDYGDVAVIIGNYKRLEPFEAEYGLNNNIISSLGSALIPRALWPDKPLVSDPRAIGLLYFRYNNSYAVTPIADLIRNFGPFGIPVGMAFLGFLLRVVYAALIEDQPRSIWRVTAYIVILSNVSYESFYGSIVQTVVRAAVILAVTLVGVNLVVRRGSAAAKLEVKT